MVKYSMNSVTWLVILISLQGATLDDRLNVEVLFESLCPDSLNFINDQLYPSWEEIAPFVNLKLVPFGKSSSLEEGKKFACQHGPQECRGNRIMSCAIQRLPDQTMQVKYVTCFMNYYRLNRNNVEDIGLKCTQAVALDADQLMNCYLTKEGTLHQLQAEIDTKRITPKFVPTILYNGVFDQQLQDESLVNFKGVVCGLIQDKLPGACH